MMIWNKREYSYEWKMANTIYPCIMTEINVPVLYKQYVIIFSSITKNVMYLLVEYICTCKCLVVVRNTHELYFKGIIFHSRCRWCLTTRKVFFFCGIWSWSGSEILDHLRLNSNGPNPRLSPIHQPFHIRSDAKVCQSRLEPLTFVSCPNVF